MIVNDVKYKGDEEKNHDNQIDGIKKRQKSNTISMFIKIVQNDNIKIINRRSIASYGRKITITNREKTQQLLKKGK